MKLRTHHPSRLDNPITIGGLPKQRKATAFKTKVQDLSNKIRIKIDERTTVWAKAGSDIEAIREKYRVDREFRKGQCVRVGAVH